MNLGALPGHLEATPQGAACPSASGCRPLAGQLRATRECSFVNKPLVGKKTLFAPWLETQGQQFWALARWAQTSNMLAFLWANRPIEEMSLRVNAFLFHTRASLWDDKMNCWAL